MNYFGENTTSHFVTQLPQQIQLHGVWSVALTEIQVPLTFQHIPSTLDDRMVILECIARDPTTSNQTRAEEPIAYTTFVQPGIYEDVKSLVDEINNLDGIQNHLEFEVERGGYVRVSRICTESSVCNQLDHNLSLSKRLRKILGFENITSRVIAVNDSAIGDRPANLSNALPTMLMLYSDILEPYMTGDVQARLLRAVSLNFDNYTYGGVMIKQFSPSMYLPLLFNTFRTIELDIRDQLGEPIPFDYGTLTATLHFKRIE